MDWSDPWSGDSAAGAMEEWLVKRLPETITAVTTEEIERSIKAAAAMRAWAENMTDYYRGFAERCGKNVLRMEQELARRAGGGE